MERDTADVCAKSFVKRTLEVVFCLQFGAGKLWRNTL